MKRVLFVLSIGALVNLGRFVQSQVSGGEPQVEDQQAMQACLDSGVSAMRLGDGEQLVRRIDNATFTYFAELKRKALRGSPGATRVLSPTRKCFVLLMRHGIPPDLLQQMRTRELIVYMAQYEMLGIGGPLPGLGSIGVGGKFAPILETQDVRRHRWQVSKEGGEWKLNLLSTFDVSEALLRAGAKESGMTHDEYIVALIEEFVGKPVPPTIWDPIVVANHDPASAED